MSPPPPPPSHVVVDHRIAIPWSGQVTTRENLLAMPRDVYEDVEMQLTNGTNGKRPIEAGQLTLMRDGIE